MNERPTVDTLRAIADAFNRHDMDASVHGPWIKFRANRHASGVG